MRRRLCRVVSAFALCLLSAGCGEEARLNEALKTSEELLQSARTQVEQARVANSGLLSALQAAGAERGVLERQCDALRSRAEQLEAYLARKDAETADLTVKVRELEAALPREQNKTQTAESIDKQLRADLAKVIVERDRASRDAAAARQALTQKDAEIARVNLALRDANTKARTAGADDRADDMKLKDAQDRARDLSAQADDLQKKLNAANARAKKADDRGDDLQKDVDSIEKEVRRLRKKLTDAGLKP